LQRADRIDRPLRPKWRSLSAGARNLAAQYGAFTAKMKRKLDAALAPAGRLSVQPPRSLKDIQPLGLDALTDPWPLDRFAHELHRPAENVGEIILDMDHVEQGEAGGGIVPDEQIDIARGARLAATEPKSDTEATPMRRSSGWQRRSVSMTNAFIHSHIITQNAGPSGGFR
jgi:hypothetical protein